MIRLSGVSCFGGFIILLGQIRCRRSQKANINFKVGAGAFFLGGFNESSNDPNSQVSGQFRGFTFSLYVVSRNQAAMSKRHNR